MNAPCGNSRHFEWINDKWPCPSCAALEHAREKSEADELLNLQKTQIQQLIRLNNALEECIARLGGAKMHLNGKTP